MLSIINATLIDFKFLWATVKMAALNCSFYVHSIDHVEFFILVSPSASKSILTTSVTVSAGGHYVFL